MAHSSYAAVTPTGRRNTWHWHRPNGERVPLYGFNEHQVRHIAPALHAVDVHLKPQHRLSAYVQLRRPIWHQAFSRASQPKNAALTYSNRPFKKHDKVEVSSKVFDRKSHLHPAGVFAHEVGHLIGPDSRRHNRVSHEQLQEFRHSFGYKSGGFIRRDNVSKYGKTKDNILRGHKTRQAQGAHEDFAETFRASLGVPLHTQRSTPREQHYLTAHVDAKRREYLHKHYIW